MTSRWLVAGLPLAYVVLLFVIPIGLIVLQSVHFPEITLEEYSRLTTLAVQRSLINSLALAAESSLLAALLGTAILIAVLRWGRRWRSLIGIWLLLPFAASELVRIVAWIVLLGPEGPVAQPMISVFGSAPEMVKSHLGALIGLVHVQIPFFVLTAMPVVLGVSAELRRAAASLGANQGQGLLTIFLPLAFPGLLAAWVLSFFLALGYLATPSALGGTQEQLLLPALISQKVHDLGDWAGGSALGVLLLIATLIGLALLSRVGGLATIYSGLFRAGGRRRAGLVSRLWAVVGYSRAVERSFEQLSRRTVTSLGKVVHAAIVLTLLVYLAAPAVAAIPASLTEGRILKLPPTGLSLRWYEFILSDPGWTSAIGTSLLVAVPAAIIATALGFCGAVALVRGYFRAGSRYFTVLLLPLFMPIVVTALGLFFVTIATNQAFTIRAFLLAYPVLALPYAVIVLTASLQSFDWNVDLAAQSLGADWIHRLRDIMLPMLRPAILVSLLFTFLLAFTELIFALLMQTTELTTMPVKMWLGIRHELSPATAAAAGLTTLATVVAVAMVFLLRIGRGSRAAQRRQ
jgi:putative spermidine/putrescine transport system permease protein